MKMSNYEAIKMIKQLTSEKEELQISERANSIVVYSADETPPKSSYSFEDTRAQIEAIDKKIRTIKFALAKANTTVLLPNFDITIGEGLVMMAQLQEELRQISPLVTYENHFSSYNVSTGTLKYTDTLYDVETVRAKKKELYNMITKLQTAIDKANINYEFDINI